ncbi:MAG: large conductance mechanosensitive channel [Candidatus Saccharimonadales bacterium]|jgi:large conductance mechanosensitive channel
MSGLIKGFMSFVKEQGVVGLAVGLAIGIQASNAVSSIVSNFIDPLVALVLNGTDFSSITSEVERGGEIVVFGWGNILQAVITLVATALIVYLVVKKLGLDKKSK